MTRDLEAYTPLTEAEYLPVARRVLSDDDPNLPPLDERIATILFHAAGSKYDNRFNHQMRIDAEIRSGALVLAIQAALAAIKEDEYYCQGANEAGQVLRAALKGEYPKEQPR